MNYFKKHKVAIGIFLALVATVALAAGFERIPKDLLILGTGSSSSKVMEYDLGLGAANPKIRANSVSPFLEFASDGTSFLPFGSGGGGASGVNVISNGDFELGSATGWTASGGVLADEEGADVINGTKSASWNPDAAAQTLTSDQSVLPLVVDGRTCVTTLSYKDGDSNYFAEVIDGSSNVLGGVALKTAAITVDILLPFLCPTSGTVAVRLRATADAAEIFLDDVFSGTKDIVVKSLELASVNDPLLTLSGGGLQLGDGRILKTYDGAGTDASDYGGKLTVDLDVIFTTNPVNATTYSFCIDKDTLTASTVLGGSGESVVKLEEANFKVLADTPENILTSRYLCLGYVRSADTGTVWSGDGSRFADFPRNSAPPPVAVNPIIFSQKQSVGSVGSVANAQGPLVDGDFPNTTTLHYWHLDGDTLDDGPLSVPLVLNGAPTDNSKGFFGRENLYTLDGSTQYISASDADFSFTSTTDDISFVGWFDIDGKWTDSFDANLFSVGTGTFLSLKRDGVGRLSLVLSPSADTITLDNISALNDGKGHHFAAVINSGTMLLYIDGQLAGSVAATEASATDNVLELGRRAASSSNYFPGNVQGFAVHKGTALTASQVNALYSKRFTNHKQIAGGHVLTPDSFPFNDLTGKVSFWNLSDVNDGSVNALNLLNEGVTTFDGFDIYGQATRANFNGTTQSLKLTVTEDPTGITNPGPGDSFTTGALFKAEGPNAFFVVSNTDGGADRGWAINGTVGAPLVLFWPISSSTQILAGTIIDSIQAGKTYHVVLSYDSGTKRLKTFLNGVKTSDIVTVDARGQTASVFRLSGRLTALSGAIDGVISEGFFAQSALSASDIKKLASARLDHGVLTPPEFQEWVGLYDSEDGLTKNEFNKGWVLDKKQSSVYIDPGLNSGDVIEMKLKDNGFSPTVVPVQKFNATYTSDPCAAAECSINHNLPGRPSNVEVWHEVNVGEWERQDPSTCQATTSTLVCLFTGITTIDGTRKLNVIASMSDLASAFEGDPITSGAQTFSGAKTWNGAQTFVGGIDGVTDGSNALAGQVGEYIEVLGTLAASSGSWTVSAALAVPAGDWDLSFVFASLNNCGASSTGVQVNLSLGISAGSAEAIDSYSYLQSACNGGKGGYVVLPSYRVSLTTLDNYYIKTLAVAASFGSPTAYKISARRVR